MITSRIVRRRTVGAAVALFAAMPTAVLVAAAPADAAPGTAFVRAAHLSPDTPGVDVYVAAQGARASRWLSDVDYGDVSAYRRVPAGDYTVAMRPHGAAASSKPLVSWTVDLHAGRAYTAAATGRAGALHGIEVDNPLRAPAAGTGLVRVISASSRAGTVDVTANGTRLASGVPFGHVSAYTTVPSRSWSVRVASTTSPGVGAGAAVPVADQSVDSLVVLDSASGGIVVRPVVDAAGAASVPSGSVDAGGGGTATHVIGGGTATHVIGGGTATHVIGGGGSRVSGWPVLGAALVALAGAALLLRRRGSAR